MVLKIAHRGGSALRPENTLEAFDFALRFDIDGIECDVRICDDILVVFHDDDLERCTDGKGKISEVSFEYLRSLKICGNNQACSIPTLDETLCLIRNRDKALLFLEIKPMLVMRGLFETEYKSYPDVDIKVNDMLMTNSMVTSTVVISFDWLVLKKIREKNPSIVTGIIVSLEMANLTTDAGISSLITEATKIGCRWINMDKGFFDGSDEEARFLLTRLKGRGFLTDIWTVNDYIDMKRLIRLGVDAITSDRPELLAIL